jgi:hypothetical protein
MGSLNEIKELGWDVVFYRTQQIIEKNELLIF